MQVHTIVRLCLRYCRGGMRWLHGGSEGKKGLEKFQVIKTSQRKGECPFLFLFLTILLSNCHTIPETLCFLLISLLHHCGACLHHKYNPFSGTIYSKVIGGSWPILQSVGERETNFSTKGAVWPFTWAKVGGGFCEGRGAQACSRPSLPCIIAGPSAAWPLLGVRRH